MQLATCTNTCWTFKNSVLDQFSIVYTTYTYAVHTQQDVPAQQSWQHITFSIGHHSKF